MSGFAPNLLVVFLLTFALSVALNRIRWARVWRMLQIRRRLLTSLGLAGGAVVLLAEYQPLMSLALVAGCLSFWYVVRRGRGGDVSRVTFFVHAFFVVAMTLCGLAAGRLGARVIAPCALVTSTFAGECGGGCFFAGPL